MRGQRFKPRKFVQSSFLVLFLYLASEAQGLPSFRYRFPMKSNWVSSQTSQTRAFCGVLTVVWT